MTNDDLQQLRLIRNRIDRLRDIYYSLVNAPVSVEDWRTWLDRYTALNAQYQALWRELADERLANVLLQPEIADLKVPDVLLRTKVEPEIHSACLLPPTRPSPSATPRPSPGLQARHREDRTALVKRLQEADEQFEDEMAALSSGSSMEDGEEDGPRKSITGRWQDLRR